MVLYAPFWCSRCASVHVCVHVRYLCFGVPNLSLALVRVAKCKGEGAATSTTRAGGRGRASAFARGVRGERGAAPPYLCVLTNAISYHSPKRVCMTSNRVNLTEHGSLVVQFLWYTLRWGCRHSGLRVIRGEPL